MAASAQRESTVSSSVLLFQIDSADGCSAERANLLAEDQITHLQTLLAPQSSFESRLRQDVQSIMESIMREDGQIDIVVLASRLALIGHKVSIRTAMGGGSGQECFRNLNYEFLLVAQIGSEGRELIVDPKFREQFKLSQQTDRYTQLLNLLPDAYIGQHTRLATLVRLLSSEMESAFSETGITMPPWRQIGSMMSKWKPLKSKDTEVNSPTLGGISPRGALSLCSSRSSSSCSDSSPQRSRSFTSSLQRQESIPRKIQSGFNVDSSHVCSRIPEYTTLKRFGDRSEPGFCQDCAFSSEGEKRVRKAGYQDFQPGQESQIGPVQCKTNLGLAKIRTVKLGGPVR